MTSTIHCYTLSMTLGKNLLLQPNVLIEKFAGCVYAFDRW
jgi:hypothetical protein